jgi:hypothetical protein
LLDQNSGINSKAETAHTTAFPNFGFLASFATPIILLDASRIKK